MCLYQTSRCLQEGNVKETEKEMYIHINLNAQDPSKSSL